MCKLAVSLKIARQQLLSSFAIFISSVSKEFSVESLRKTQSHAHALFRALSPFSNFCLEMKVVQSSLTNDTLTLTVSLLHRLVSSYFGGWPFPFELSNL